MRYSDDGEPQGTAGMPILEVLRHENLTDCVCVVTRYFGGILLGTGGLVRAYTQARRSLSRRRRAAHELYTVALIACPYNLYDIVTHLLPEYDCAVEETDYGADVTLTVTCRQAARQAERRSRGGDRRHGLCRGHGDEIHGPSREITESKNFFENFRK